MYVYNYMVFKHFFSILIWFGCYLGAKKSVDKYSGESIISH